MFVLGDLDLREFLPQDPCYQIVVTNFLIGCSTLGDTEGPLGDPCTLLLQVELLVQCTTGRNQFIIRHIIIYIYLYTLAGVTERYLLTNNQLLKENMQHKRVEKTHHKCRNHRNMFCRFRSTIHQKTSVYDGLLVK